VNKIHLSSLIDSDVVVLHWCSEYEIPKEGPGTALSAPSHPMLVSGACVTGWDSFKKLVEQMKSGGLDQDDSDDKTFKYELVSS
jgi:hypothetical protein